MNKPSAARRAAANRAANAIVEALFVNGAGKEADRLVLTGEDGRDLGGYCKGAVVDLVRRLVLEAFQDFAPVGKE